MTLDETFKAAKAGDLTNDTTYKVGEISRKTGLQKQPDGSWAPPKKTNYGKVTTNKNGEVGIQQTLGKGSKFEKFGSEKEAASHEEKLNQLRTVHSSEKLGNGQTLELTESKKNGKFFVKIDGKPVSCWKTKEAAQKEFDAYKNGEDPAAARYNEIVGRYNKKHPENPMETKEPVTRSAASNELRLKDGQKPSKRSEAFKKPLNKIIESAKTYGDLQEQLIEVLSSWSGENEGYLRNRSLDELANIYVDIRNDYYTDEENHVDFSNGIRKATLKSQKDAAPKLTGDCKIRIRK